MTDDERRLRQDLATLAGSERGRRLLQLGLRGIERDDRGVTAGCWSERGIAGCLFQHAYWQAVREGVFTDRGRPGDWIGNFVGPHDYGIVIRVIESFDRLARSGYSDVQPRRLRPNRVRVRQSEWNAAVEQLLVETLGEDRTEPRHEESPVTASV
ncbi:MAG TPA: hypothetical protein VGL51_14220 [Solirubrobacteraceae bacterium]|jgi:hypothetical protein